MFTYLLATFCLAGSCETAIVASSEQDPRLTMTSCSSGAQLAIAGFVAGSLKYRNWEFSGYRCIEGKRSTAS